MAESSYEQWVQQAQSEQQREQYWQQQSEAVSWFKKPQKILDSSNPPFYRWFSDGTLNTCYNCVDRHIPKLGSKVGLIYDSPITGKKSVYTYNEILENVSRLGAVLRELGVNKGDRVIIYMPMIPEAVFSMLACARVGAIHSVVFGGFAAKELASRIMDAEPNVIITASCGIEPPKKIIQYKKNVDEAIGLSGRSIKVLLYQREEYIESNFVQGVHYDYREMMSKVNSVVDCVEVESIQPLYILYTSGTTGSPKGVCRDNGGNAVALCWTMRNVFNVQEGDVFFSSSDIGWVVGHSFIVYGPLMVGGVTILFEGKPVGTPDPGTYWRIIQEYNVKSFYTAPTALRAIRKEDTDGVYFKKYNLSSLDNIGVVGERSDIPTLEWLKKNIPQNILINDTYWQTETGWPICSNYAYQNRFKEKFGSCIKPAPGYVVHALNDQHEIQSQNVLGNICIKLPLPPSCLLTLYKNDEGFINKYLSDNPGYYTTGDAGYFDENGYLHIMARVDDVINTAGHRLSTAQMEEILNWHPAIAESAVVAHRDELRGEVPLGFVVVKNGFDIPQEILENQLIQKIRNEIGAVAVFRKCLIVPKLPKTRSGKILRGILKKIIDGLPFKTPATIEDESVLVDIQNIVKNAQLGVKIQIYYEEDIQGQNILNNDEL